MLIQSLSKDLLSTEGLSSLGEEGSLSPGLGISSPERCPCSRALPPCSHTAEQGELQKGSPGHHMYGIKQLDCGQIAFSAAGDSWYPHLSLFLGERVLEKPLDPCVIHMLCVPSSHTSMPAGPLLLQGGPGGILGSDPAEAFTSFRAKLVLI